MKELKTIKFNFNTLGLLGFFGFLGFLRFLFNADFLVIFYAFFCFFVYFIEFKKSNVNTDINKKLSIYRTMLSIIIIVNIFLSISYYFNNKYLVLSILINFIFAGINIVDAVFV